MSEQLLAAQIAALERRIKELEGRETPEYSTGSFVPTLVGSGTAGVFTYDTNATKVEWARAGNRLYFNGRLVITAIPTPPVGNMDINGWPFAGVSDANMAIAGGATIILWQTNLATAHTQIEGQFANGSSSMRLLKSGDNIAAGSVAAGDIALVGGTLEFRLFGTYRIG